MTRVNGKGPKPPMLLKAVRVERSPLQTSVLFEIVGGAQDGAALAMTVLHPGGVPQIALQTLLTPDLKRVLAEGELDPVEAMRLVPPEETLHGPLAE